MFLKRAFGVLGRVARSPLTGKILQGAKIGLETAGMLGVPFSSGLAKGVGIAQNILDKV